MSERMIERERARLLAAQKGKRNTAGSSVNGVGGGKGTTKSGKSQSQAPRTPQEKAAASLRSEDQQLDCFLQRLVYRDDSRETFWRVPTVPTSLSRRVLNRQGAGFLDSTVAAMVSAAGDRFLATVLHQAGACRDQRLKGAEAQREASRVRKRHLEQVAADKDDRERRKAEVAMEREAVNLKAIAAAQAASNSNSKGTSEKDGDSSSPKSKKSKKKNDDNMVNGSKVPEAAAASAATTAASAKRNHSQQLGELDDDDEVSVDSLDEEEDYYLRYYGDEDNTNLKSNKNEGEDEDDEALILRDFTQPLEAWGFGLTGKLGLLPRSMIDDDNNNNNGEGVETDTTAIDGADFGGGDGLQDAGDEAENDDIDSEDDEDMDISAHPSSSAAGAASSSSKKTAPSAATTGDSNNSNDKRKSPPPSSQLRNTNSPLPTT